LTATDTPPGWAEAIDANAGEQRTARRLIPRLAAIESAALDFCRLLERWARGEAEPSTAEARTAALREAAGRVDVALAALQSPLERFLVELEPEAAERRSWFGEPSWAELVDWQPVLSRAGVAVPAHAVAVAYLELAVLVRALEGLSDAVRWEAGPDRGSLWAGLFDLRENLLGRARDDVRALAA
jgi:hypothetical protein